MSDTPSVEELCEMLYEARRFHLAWFDRDYTRKSWEKKYDAIRAGLEALGRERDEAVQRLSALSNYTLEESEKVPESLRGDRDWWQQNCAHWYRQAQEWLRQRNRYERRSIDDKAERDALRERLEEIAVVAGSACSDALCTSPRCKIHRLATEEPTDVD